MSRRSLVLLALLVAAVSGACRATAGSPSASPSPSVAPSVDVAALTSTAWRLVDLAGEPVAEQPGRSIAFGVDGSVAGTGGCNTFRGSVVLGVGTLTIGELSATEMGCADPAAMDVETRFLAALDAATTWLLGDDDTLVLDGPGGRLAFVEA